MNPYTYYDLDKCLTPMVSELAANASLASNATYYIPGLPQPVYNNTLQDLFCTNVQACFTYLNGSDVFYNLTTNCGKFENFKNLGFLKFINFNNHDIANSTVIADSELSTYSSEFAVYLGAFCNKDDAGNCNTFLFF
jgi:hypothetical protein